jgi:hypothetical protein
MSHEYQAAQQAWHAAMHEVETAAVRLQSVTQSDHRSDSPLGLLVVRRRARYLAAVGAEAAAWYEWEHLARDESAD